MSVQGGQENLVRVDKQRAVDLRRPQGSTNYVPAGVRPEMPPGMAQRVEMLVDHPARQAVVVTTNALDRAKGYHLVLLPLAVVVGVLAVLVSVFFENQLLSFTSLLIFWLVFVFCWAGGWVVTALATPEFVSWYSAKRQWDVIEREQVERWAHYRWQFGRAQASPPWWAVWWPWLVAGSLLWFLLCAAVVWGWA